MTDNITGLNEVIEILIENGTKPEVEQLCLEYLQRLPDELSLRLSQEGKIEEIKNQIKEFLDNRKPIETKHIFSSNLRILTKHLFLFTELNTITRIHGFEYDVIKKALWYSIVSIVLRRKSVVLGDIRTDCRFHVSFPLPSGGGKKNLTNTIVRIAQGLGLNFAKPTSFHPEQLIGKILRKKNDIFEPIYGWFACPIIIFDEAIEFLRSNEPSYKESRKYLVTALDPYEQNELVKKMVDTPIGEALRYYPDMVCSMFFQPFYLYEELVLMGLLRRFIVPYVRVKTKFEVIDYDARLNGEDEVSITDSVNKFVKYLSDIEASIRNKDFTFSKEVIDQISSLHLEILKHGISLSEKSRNYTRIVDYDLQDKLVKMGCIQAASNFRTDVSIEDVEKAFMDLYEFFTCTLDFVDKRIIGYLDYGEGFGGALTKDAEILRWLKENGAVSKESSTITIDDYVNKICEVFDVPYRTARNRYVRHRKTGWVDSIQTGQPPEHTSKVWLTTQDVQVVQDDKLDNRFTTETNKYNSICNKIENSIQTGHLGNLGQLEKQGSIEPSESGGGGSGEGGDGGGEDVDDRTR